MPLNDCLLLTYTYAGPQKIRLGAEVCEIFINMQMGVGLMLPG
jgi:hypothetical protein